MDVRLWSNLPSEILIDILPSLPVKSLCRFKCVSPSWKTLISSPHFVQTHLSRTMANNPPSYKAILFSSSKDLYSVDFAGANPTLKMLNLPSQLFKHMGDWTKSLSSCNGLVLVSDICNFNLLLNPCTSEYKQLPRPYRRYSPDDIFYGHVLGYDSYTNDYKVGSLAWREIDFDDNNPEEIVHAAVYSLKANAWRAIQDFPSESDPVAVGQGRGVCFNERLHWLCKRTDDVNFSKVIVTFTLADEIFGEVGLPALGNHYECSDHNMVVLGGCLCLLVSLEPDRIDVWMMMEYGVRESWTRFSTAYPGWSISDVLCFSVQDDLVLGIMNSQPSRRVLEILRGFRRVRNELRDEFEGDKLDEFEDDKLVLYNPVKGTQRDLVVAGIPLPLRSLVGYHYIETLVSPNHGGQFSETR